jgi:sigma-54 specific flagellar transcriptional regulator A
LSVFPIEISPLRDRPEDIQPLVREIIGRVWRSHGIRVTLAEAAMEVLCKYQWPGNVRELSNLVERLAVSKPNGEIFVADLPWPLRPVEEPPVTLSSSLAATNTQKLNSLPDDGLDLKRHLAGIEKDLIESALHHSSGVVQKAAVLLGMGRTTLVEKIRRYGLRV